MLRPPLVNQLEFLGLDLKGRRQIQRAQLSVRSVIQEIEKAVDDYLGEPLPPGERLSDLIAAACDPATDVSPPSLAALSAEEVSDEAMRRSHGRPA